MHSIIHTHLPFFSLNFLYLCSVYRVFFPFLHICSIPHLTDFSSILPILTLRCHTLWFAHNAKFDNPLSYGKICSEVWNQESALRIAPRLRDERSGVLSPAGVNDFFLIRTDRLRSPHSLLLNGHRDRLQMPRQLYFYSHYVPSGHEQGQIFLFIEHMLAKKNVCDARH